jgi:hypothetical protein
MGLPEKARTIILGQTAFRQANAISTAGAKNSMAEQDQPSADSDMNETIERFASGYVVCRFGNTLCLIELTFNKDLSAEHSQFLNFSKVLSQEAMVGPLV